MRVALFLFALFLVSTPVHSQPIRWKVSLEMEKTTWLAGEPISVFMKAINIASNPVEFRWGYLYLDASTEVCIDRATPMIANVDLPPGSTGQKGIPVLYAPATVHSVRVNVSRVCNMIISDPNLIGSHTICYASSRSSTERSCAKFEVIAPKGPDYVVYSRFPPNLRDIITDGKSQLREELLQKYPTSNYTAYLLWELGDGLMKEIGAEKDFEYYQKELEMYKNSPRPSERAREHITKNVINPWDQLYRNFPDFVYRPELLYGLSRAYFRAGQPEKAVPLLKELLERFPKAEPAKKGQAYKQLLKTHNLWKN